MGGVIKAGGNGRKGRYGCREGRMEPGRNGRRDMYGRSDGGREEWKER